MAETAIVRTRLGLDPAPRVTFKSVKISRFDDWGQHPSSLTRTFEILFGIGIALRNFRDLPDATSFRSGERSHPALCCCFKLGEGRRRNDGWRSLFALFRH